MALDPKKTALIVIDVQNEYFEGKWPIPDGNAALDKIEAAVEASQQTGAKVIYVQHEVLNPERGLFIRGPTALNSIRASLLAPKTSVSSRIIPARFPKPTWKRRCEKMESRL